MTTLKEIEETLAQLEADVQNIQYNVERAAIFDNASKKMLALGDTKRAEELKWEYELFYFRLQAENNATVRFAPQIDAGGYVLPDIKTFSPQQIDYYENRAGITKNPIHRALYNDFIWENRKKHVYARAAIEAYLDCASIYCKQQWFVELIDAIRRAARLSTNLNDPALIEKVRLLLVSLVESFNASKEYRWCIEPIESLLTIKRYLKGKELENCVKILEAAVEHYQTIPDGYHVERSFLELLMELMKALKTPEESLTYAKKIADSFEREGDWKLTHYASGDLVAAHFYEQAALSYRELGERQKTSDLLIKIKEHTQKGESTLKVILTDEIVVQMGPVRQYIKELTEKDLSGALQSISINDFFVPNVRAIRMSMPKEKSVSSIFPILSIRDGNPVLHSLTEDEIAEERVVNAIVREYSYKAFILNELIDALVEKKGLDSKSIVSFLLKSPVYEKSSSEILEVGFERYFKADYVSCLHVLIPQLEKALRTMLYKLNIPTTCIDKDSIQEKLLGAILRETKLNLLLGESIVYYFKAVLEDKRGSNLRNDVAHGLVDYDDCSRESATNILNLFLILTRFTFNHGICYGYTVDDFRKLEE